ncbi:MAG: thermonuclease family protein [Microthrixaceae bacterium]|nr:thermonuclease family protein [Microthrixaceae bacterium]
MCRLWHDRPAGGRRASRRTQRGGPARRGRRHAGGRDRRRGGARPPDRGRHPRVGQTRTEVECYGKEASEHTEELLPEGTEVVLERDIEARDRYDRLLAYVYRASDGVFVNLAMIDQGYAQPAAYPPNVAHTEQFTTAGGDAYENGRGLWGACGGDDLYG